MAKMNEIGPDNFRSWKYENQRIVAIKEELKEISDMDRIGESIKRYQESTPDAK